jgi:hypothetical protein
MAERVEDVLIERRRDWGRLNGDVRDMGAGRLEGRIRRELRKIS